MLTHLTPKRLATVQRFFRTQNDRDLLGCYAWTQALSSGMLPILGDFEVALRNALHRALSLHYSGGVHESFDWMMPRPNPAVARNPNAPAYISAHHKMGKHAKDNIQSAMSNVARAKHRGYVVSQDDIVAALSFGFWEKLIESLGHPSHPAGLQEAILSQALPYAPVAASADYGDEPFRLRVRDLLMRIRDIRNRIGHHDAIWTTPEFDDVGRVGFIPRKPRHTITNMAAAMEKVAWLAGWIDPPIPDYMKQTDHWWTFNVLLSRDALAVYRQRGGNVETYKTLLGQPSGQAPCRQRRPEKIRQLLARVEKRRYHF